MIYLDDSIENTLYCISEGMYLGEKFSDRFGNSDILINPLSIKYVTGKCIIINQPNYPKENIDILRSNGGNTIISRVKLDYMPEDVEFDPYEIQVELSVMWNGMYICVNNLDINEITQKLENSIIFSEDRTELYFPKLLNIKEELIRDSEGNITALGWLLHQVGINTAKNSVFQDLDALKIQKILP